MKNRSPKSALAGHPDAGVLLDWSERRLPPSAAASVETHVSRCRRCEKLLAELTRIRQRLEGRHLEAPPDWLVARAEDVREADGGRRRQPQPAAVRMVFDSWEAVPIGVRSASSVPRRLVFRAGSCDLDIEVEPLARGSVRLHGQVLHAAGRSVPSGGGTARLVRGARIVARTRIDRDGRFLFDKVSSGKTASTLHVELPGLDLEIPDIPV